IAGLQVMMLRIAASWQAFLVIWGSNLTGALVAAPPLLMASEARDWWRASRWRARSELFGFLAAILGVSLAMYLPPASEAESFRPLVYWLIMLVLGVSLRFGAFGVAGSVLLAAFIAGDAVAHGHGVFSALPGSEQRQVAFTQAYVVVMTLIGAITASVVTGLRKTLEVLRVSEARFRQLADAAPVAMILLEPDQETIFFNKTMTKLFGYEPEDIRTVGEFWRKTQPDPARRALRIKEWAERLEEARTNGGVFRPLVTEGFSKDGSLFVVEAHASQIGDRRLTVLVDLRERYKAEDALRASEALFRQLINSAPISMSVIDPDRETMTHNRRFTALTGYGGEEIPTISAWWLKAFPDPAYRTESRALWATRVREWQESDTGFRPLELDIVRKDGAKRHIEARTAKIGDRRVTTLVDLTERHAAEEALRASEEQLRAMFDSAAVAIALARLDGTPYKTNPALSKLLGYSEEEFCARPWTEFTHPADVANALPQVRELVAGRLDSFQAERRYMHKDGTIVPARVTLSLIRDAHGAPASMVAMMEDISQRARLEESLRQAQKMDAMGQLTSGIAHDFNNMLSIIIGNIELVRATVGDSLPLVVAELDDTSDAARRGAEMIQKLLGFSRQAELRKVPLNITTVVGNFQPLLRRLLPTNIEITSHLDEEVGTVRADVGAIEQILVNLATNARDAMPGGGTIRIDVSQSTLTPAQRAAHSWVTEGTYVALSVADTGSGMSAATLRMMFEPFFTTKAEGRGTGLGMAMIDGLAKQHEGFVEIESEVDKGTTVRVWFPVVPDDAKAISSGETPGASIPGGSETILLVEDKAALLRVATRILERLGYRVITAPDGAAALEAYRAHADEIALVVSDMVMPRMQGHELYRAVRDGGSKVPFVFTSGYSPAELRSRAALGEDVMHLSKPLSLEQLAKAVRLALERHPTGGRQ
ncbi:MAG: PAS domain S-box protein, partial [Gemmatimonadales bacterium]